MRRLRLVPDGTNIPFFRYRWIAFGWSLFVLVATILLVTVNGLNFGIDFKGGVLIEVRTPGPADLATMRATLGELDLGEISLQTAGADDQVMIRAKAPEGAFGIQADPRQLVGIYEDRFVRAPEGWRFAERRGRVLYHTA